MSNITVDAGREQLLLLPSSSRAINTTQNASPNKSVQKPMRRKEAPNVLMTRDDFLPAFYTLPRLRASGKEHLGIKKNFTFFWGEKKIDDTSNHVPLGTGPRRGGWTRQHFSPQN